jgi:hypothetical protein
MPRVLRLSLLTFHESNHFLKNETNLAPSVSDPGKLIRTCAAVVNGFLRAANDFCNSTSTDPCFASG